MPRVHFSVRHVAVPHPAMSIVYEAGQTYLVSQAVAAEAVRLGRGEIVPSPGERTSEAPSAAGWLEPDNARW